MIFHHGCPPPGKSTIAPLEKTPRRPWPVAVTRNV